MAEYGINPQDTCFAKGVEQFYNGNEYNNVIDIERKSNIYLEDYYKLNNRGIIYHKSYTLTVQTVQAFFVETQRILATTNF